MRFIVIKAGLVILILAATHLRAQDFADSSLLGSKARAFGGAFVAVADDPSALYWNPAALIQLKRPTLMFSSNDAFSFDFVGATTFSPLIGTLALGLSRITTDATHLEMASTAFGYRYKKELALGGSINLLKRADKIRPRLCLALFFQPQKVYASNQGGRSWWRFCNNVFIAQRLTLGVALRNFNLSSRKPEEDWVLDAGFAYLFPPQWLLLAAAYKFSAGEGSLGGGLELRPSKWVRLRAGSINLGRLENFLGGGFHSENWDVDMIYSINSEKIELSLTLRLGEPPLSSATRYYRQGVEYVKNGDFRRAVTSFEKSLQYNPDSEKTTELIKTLRKRITEQEKRIADLLSEAMKYQARGWYLMAATKYIEILRLQPHHELALKRLKSIRTLLNRDIAKIFKKGVEFFDEGDYKNARQIFKKIRLVKRNHQPSAEYLTRIDRIFATRAQEHYFRGLGYYHQKRWKRAVKEFREVLNYQPKNQQARKYLTDAEAQIEKIKAKVKSLFDEAVRNEEGREYVNAYKKFRQILQLDPDHAQAKSRIEKLRPRVSIYASMRFQQGVESFKQRNFKESVRAFQEVLSIVPEHREAKNYLQKAQMNLSSEVNRLYKRGMKYINGGNWVKAMSAFRKALELNPNQPRVKKKMGEVLEMLDCAQLLQDGKSYLGKGDYLQALQLFNRVLDKDPENPAALKYVQRCQIKLDSLADEHFNKGLRYYSNEDYALAISEWDTVLAIVPNHRAATDYKKRAQEKLEALEKLP